MYLRRSVLLHTFHSTYIKIFSLNGLEVSIYLDLSSCRPPCSLTGLPSLTNRSDTTTHPWTQSTPLSITSDWHRRSSKSPRTLSPYPLLPSLLWKVEFLTRGPLSRLTFWGSVVPVLNWLSLTLRVFRSPLSSSPTVICVLHYVLMVTLVHFP